MKDSGIEWIGEIPKGWNITKSRFFLREISEKNHPNSEILSMYREYGVIPKSSRNDNHNVTSADTSGYKFVRKGNLVINKMKAWQGSMAISDFEGIVSPAYYIYTVDDTKFNLSFLHYALRNPAYIQEYMRISSGLRIGQWDLNKDEFKNVRYVFPSKEIQIKIADFLDEKTSKIDEIISDTKKSIDELNKYKQSIITEAVTKGLDPNAKMVPSCIEWIGDIPESWEISKSRFFLKEISKKGFPDEEVLSLYRDFGVIPKSSRNDNHNVTSLDTSGYKLVNKDNLVINKMKAWQGSMAISPYRGIISPAYYIYEINSKKINLKFLHYSLRNKSYFQEYKRISSGLRIGQWDLNKNEFKNIKYAYPKSIKEQNEIVDYIESSVNLIDKLIIDKENVLKEYDNYKKSLIYEYVTGKKEVSVEN